MVDTLSQNEIDALLSALQTSGDASATATPEPASSVASSVVKDTPAKELSPVSDELSSFTGYSYSHPGNNGAGSSHHKKKHKGKEKLYDFKRQTKFAKEQISTLQIIHGNFARLMSTDISTRLRMSVTATVISVTQETFEEFVGSIFPPTFITVIRSDTLDGEAMLQMDLSIVFSIIDRLLGGNGTPLSTLRQLTDVEKQLMQKVMLDVLDRLRESWTNIVDLMPVIEFIESNPQFAQIVPPNDVVATIKIEINILDTTGNLKLCIPYSSIETISHKLNAIEIIKVLRNTNNRTEKSTDTVTLGKHIKSSYIDVVAELGRATIPLGDILKISVGDYLPLNQRAKEEINIRVGNSDLIKFNGRPGIKGKKMAIQITKVLTPPNEEEDN